MEGCKIFKSKGYHFNNHYMNSHTKIDGWIMVEIPYIQSLNPYVGELKSIRVTSNKNTNESIDSLYN